MEAATKEVTNIIDSSLAVGGSRADIEALLAEKGYELSAFAHHIEESLKQHALKRRNNGQLLIGAGVFTCFSSCVITLLSDSISGSNFTLIGLTTAGIILLFAGLTKFF